MMQVDPCSLATAWAVKYDFQLIGQSEDAKMRSLLKDGIEHRHYRDSKTRWQPPGDFHDREAYG